MIRARTSSGSHGHEESHPALDLTPLVDVIFILLVFFLLTASSVDRALTVDLPQEGADQATPVTTPRPITLTLLAGEARWAVDDQSFRDWPEVERMLLRLRVERPTAEIVIAGERSTPLERVLQALAFLRREQWSVARILMETPLSDPP